VTITHLFPAAVLSYLSVQDWATAVQEEVSRSQSSNSSSIKPVCLICTGCFRLQCMLAEFWPLPQLLLDSCSSLRPAHPPNMHSARTAPFFNSKQHQPLNSAAACVVLCCVVLCCAVLCCVVLCCVVLCCVVLCCVQYVKAQHQTPDICAPPNVFLQVLAVEPDRPAMPGARPPAHSAPRPLQLPSTKPTPDLCCPPFWNCFCRSWQ
jgi:hypothetical protein